MYFCAALTICKGKGLDKCQRGNMQMRWIAVKRTTVPAISNAVNTERPGNLFSQIPITYRPKYEFTVIGKPGTARTSGLYSELRRRTGPLLSSSLALWRRSTGA